MAAESVRTEDLVRTFKTTRGELKALDEVSVNVKPGEIFGVLGPNGAGKTTLIKILCTLLLPTSGKAFVQGYDVVTEAQKIREVINMASGGETPGYGLLSVEENLWFFSQLYGIPNDEAEKRIGELVEMVGLSDKADERMNRLSSGMKQKLNLARALVNDPMVLFLDEPTLGLDVMASHQVRSYVRGWVDSNRDKTVLLTTHYMAEAEELCDRIAIVNEGKVAACGSLEELRAMVSKGVHFIIEVSYLGGKKYEVESIPGVKGASVTHSQEAGKSLVKLALDSESAIPDVISHLSSLGSKIIMLQKSEPTLETVFIDLVGRGIE